MKIQIPKRGLPISLIAPLALQWATNLGDDPEGFADSIKHEVHRCLLLVHEQGALPIKIWGAVAAFIEDLIYHYGGERIVVVKSDDQPTYYLLYATFCVLGKPQKYVISTRINMNGQPPE